MFSSWFVLTHIASLLIFQNLFLAGVCLGESTIAETPKHCAYGAEIVCKILRTTGLLSVDSTTASIFGSDSDTVQEVDGVPIAFGDVNADHFVDVLFATRNGFTLELLEGQNCVDGKTLLTKIGSRTCLSKRAEFQCNFQRPIVNVVVADFIGQNHPDILVTLQEKDGTYAIHLVPGRSGPIHANYDCKNFQPLLTGVTTQPFVLDYNGDMISDFIVSTPECRTYLWMGGQQQSELKSLEFEVDSQLHQHFLGPARSVVCLSNLTHQHFNAPHSSAFTNLNRHTLDMTPDIFVDGRESIEYVYNVPGKGFSSRDTFPFPKVPLRGQSVFIDLDYNGELEHVMPVCTDSSARSFNDCGQVDLLALNKATKKWESLLDKSTPQNDTFATVGVLSDLHVPVTLRVGDLNYDGYPDIVTLMRNRQTQKTYAAIFLNHPDKREKPSRNSFKRLFKQSWSSEAIESKNVLLVTLFDIYNNGRLNLLLTILELNGALKTFSYDYYMKNSIYFSFLRISVISGRCSDKNSGVDLCPIADSLAYGSGPPGVMACFNGPFRNQFSCSGQLSQSAHMALQLPYMIFGLGDVLNVVNDLNISVPNGGRMSCFREWDENIPGSNLIVIPYPIDQPKKWDLRVFINMSIYSIVSLLFLIGLGVFLLFLIFVLHKLERREDKPDRKELATIYLQ